ncbi:hypothetical protein MT418_004123 [Batrachochytrium dendrobatidis]
MDRYSKDSTSISLKGTKLQSKIQNCFEKGFTQTEFQNKLQRWIVGDQQSFLVVGNPYFQQMMLYINKHIIFKSVDTISQTVNRDFEIAKADVYALIKKTHPRSRLRPTYGHRQTMLFTRPSLPILLTKIGN